MADKKKSTVVEKWLPVLDSEAAPKILGFDRRRIMARLLENQEQYCIKSAQGGSFSDDSAVISEAVAANSSGAFPNATHLQGFDPVLISMVRRALPNMIAFDVVGVQPMTGPTGLVFALRTKYTSQAGTEALFNEADTGFSGTGSQAGTAPFPQNESTDYTAAAGFTTANGEAIGAGGASWNEMAFSIDKVNVAAKTRALKSEYTFEIMQDLKAVHDLDVETELSNILSTEILAEINREIIRTILNNATPGAQDDVANAGTFDLAVDANGRWAVEKFKGLMFQIERDANAIAKATRRGRGNFIICSSDVASALGMAGVLDTGNNGLGNDLSMDGDVENTFVGVLNKRFKVFVDPYCPTTVNYYVVGYKGKNQYDAGLFYCPYVPLQATKAIDPNSMQPKVAFRTRYGVASNPFANAAGDGSLVYNSNIYYRKAQVQNLL